MKTFQKIEVEKNPRSQYLKFSLNIQILRPHSTEHLEFEGT